MNTREKFVDAFGEEAAVAIEQAAAEHANGINDRNRGSDPFRWALCITIGWQCFEKDAYREHHGIKPAFEDLKAWIIEHANLAEHDGDVDYLCLFAGGYDPYIKPKEIP